MHQCSFFFDQTDSFFWLAAGLTPETYPIYLSAHALRQLAPLLQSSVFKEAYGFNCSIQTEFEFPGRSYTILANHSNTSYFKKVSSSNFQL
jgi:hypothetical protein